jgi:hypothetical protein
VVVGWSFSRIALSVVLPAAVPPPSRKSLPISHRLNPGTLS